MRNLHKGRKNRAPAIAFAITILMCILTVLLIINNIVINSRVDIKHNLIYHNTKPQLNVSSPITRNSSNVENTDWKLILVNDWNYIPEGYTVTLKTLKNDYQIDKRIYPELQEMFDAARNDGIYPLIGSAYRTKEQQQKILSDKINAYIAEGYSEKESDELAKTWVAIPGTSEHEIGLALDINAEKDKCSNDEVYSWLYQNSYKYGFILRYPADKEQITGVLYEPWHYRYVGKEAAKNIYEQGICLEEYLDM